MKIALKNGEFLSDNSSECDLNTLFVCSKLNEKYKSQAQTLGAKIIDAKEASRLLGIDSSIKIIGITGTNGKTTTATLIAFILRQFGFSIGLSGTRGVFINDSLVAQKSLTTPPILNTLYNIKQAMEFGCKYFVMEVSSHAIDQDRIDSINFALKIFTNLSQDHLDYHKTFAQYAQVKSSFFNDDGLKLINIDDEHIAYNRKNSVTYSLNRGDFCIDKFSLNNGIDAQVKFKDCLISFHSILCGKFNLYNILAAFGAVSLLTDQEPAKIANAIAKFKGVEGRTQIVSQDPLVIVDFAHTPDGIKNVLSSLNGHELIVVFGAGGDRDKTKRPIMGQIVQQYAKFSIVTSDNPRNEDPELIIDDIIAGMEQNSTLIRQPDREKAIDLAIRLSKSGEIVVILGKGDENYQEIMGVKYHFSDKEVVENLIKKRMK